MNNQIECKNKLMIGDDFGDNDCTFTCELQKEHKGRCRETFKMNGKEVSIEWEKQELK